MPFQQPPPGLGNQYDDDLVLRSYLARVLPEPMYREVETSLRELGRLAGGELYELQLADRSNEPKLTQWDAWGNRIDRVEVTALWREAECIAVEYGLVATAYEQKHGSLSRVHQCALAYLFTPSTDIYSCPLAMTDGAARTLLSSRNKPLIDHVVPHLITRNPKDFWTAGQWMTEITGGSDVGLSQTVAKLEREREGELPRNLSSKVQFDWRLYGTKWFASAITSQVALTLARPEGNLSGGRGLALFFVELRDESGRLRNIQINRLKDKLGTRKVPTAELNLNGTPAHLVIGTADGVRNIAPLLNITRLWNGISAVALMRRGLALATDYARKRTAFGAPLSEKPLHIETLDGLQSEFEAAFHFAFYVAELTGRAEASVSTESSNDRVDASPLNQDRETHLLRFLTPIMKLTTGKQAVQVLSEVIESFGGAGYVEDTGFPQLLRDAQVLPIWEGTTNVLSLDALRALGVVGSTSRIPRQPAAGNTDAAPAFEALKWAVYNCLREARDPCLAAPVRTAQSALSHAETWLTQTSRDTPAAEAGARRFAMTLGRTMELALLIKHAQWSKDHEVNDSAIAAARRFANSSIDLLSDHALDDARKTIS